MKCLKCSSSDFKIQRKRFSPEVKDEPTHVAVPCYVCRECGTPWMDAAQMNTLRREAADSYRKAHGLLTSKQIVAYREALGMSQTAFAKYLNIGEASIKRWETYFIQDASQDDHLRLKCDQTYAEINFLNVYWKQHEPDIFSGWKKFSLESFKNVALFFAKNFEVSALYLNKIYFYTDFLHFKQHGRSITGARYVPLKYGPCPDQYKILYDTLEACGSLERNGKHTYMSKMTPDLPAVLDESELDTLGQMSTLLRKKGAKALYTLSHKEKGYVDTPECQFISYEYAKNLLI